MPSDRSQRIPSYRKHKSSGQAIVTLSDHITRERRDVLLGPWGSKESRQEYARVIGEWEAAGRQLPRSQADAGSDLTIVEMLAAYWEHAQQHYRRADGTPTGEQKDVKLALRPLRVLYGHTPARDFGPLALKAVRDAMVSGSHLTAAEQKQQTKRGKPIGVCRRVANARIGRIKRAFKWAVANELIPSGVLHGLQAVSGLQRGRTEARETDPVRPVAPSVVEATLPYLTPTTAAMVQLQLVTGMRSGEVASLRAIDLDMSGPVWTYRPQQHKTIHHGHERFIAIGPRGQAIIRERLTPNLQQFIFRPCDAVAERRELARRNRRTKVFACEAARVAAKKVRKPKCEAGQRYNARAFCIAIGRAIKKANKARAEQGLPLLPHWHPHQLRHTAATLIRKEFGIDAASVALGHRSLAITDTYAEADAGKAIEVARRLG